MKIWIFLPAYNEEESLVNLLPKFKEFFSQERQIDYSILIVDDGSSDGSVKVAEAAGSDMPIKVIKHSMNRGLGETERSGFEYIAENAGEEDIVIRLDCDDTHEPQYIASMLDKLEEGYDVVNTSRFQPGGYQMGVNSYRSFISRSANVFMKILFGLTGMKDYSCGFRAYRVKKIKDAVKVFGNNFFVLEIPNERRIFFVLPYKNQTLIGTTEIRQLITEETKPTQLEIIYLIQAYNHYFKDQIKEQDVVKSFSGLRPLVKTAKDVNKITREYAIQINQNLISVFGGKWTTARKLAEKVVNKIN